MKNDAAPSQDDDPQAPLLRSSAVARLVPMPVATLRIWEQRYQAVRPRTLPSGHRRYSTDDVQRLRWLRDLVAQGHAIGALASLENQQLEQLQSRVPAAPGVAAARQVTVVGAALGARLLRPTLTPHLTQPFKLIAVWDALPPVAQLATAGADLLVWQLAGLHSVVPSELLALRSALPALQVAVVYRYAGAAALAAFAAAGIALLREPADDGQLAAWLAALPAARHAGGPAALAEWPAAAAVAPRRYDDAALAAIIGMPASLLCECPRHIAELLLQLAQFEQYSAACRNDSPDDAALHAHLQEVAAASRSLFETALERVISHAGSAPA